MSATHPRSVGLALDDSRGSWARISAVLPWVRASTRLLGRVVGPPVGAVEELDLLVVDGHVEIPSTVRDGATMVAVRTLDGDHERSTLGRRAAAWIAPFPAALEPDGTSAALRRATVHAGFLSPLASRRPGRAEARRHLGVPRDARHVTVLESGQAASRLGRLAAGARNWSVGAARPSGAVPGPVAGDAVQRARQLAAADVIVCEASLAAVSDAAALGRPVALVLDECGDPWLAEALEALGAAVVLDAWPRAADWPALLAELLDQEGPGLARLWDGRAAARAAGWIDAWAEQPPVAPATPRRPVAADDEPVPSAS